ncbi:response regulator [Candidatus Gracilibacteria bacterium]|nr:response regulator [Candidatus Gracilibacteria bacterium]
MANILVVDDYSPSHRLVSFILQQYNHHVVSAFNGVQALERLAEIDVDLVLTDLAMPKMDGIGLLQEMRVSERLRQIPVIMLTASGQRQERARAEAAGIEMFLTKPIESEELVMAVEQALASRAVARLFCKSAA